MICYTSGSQIGGLYPTQGNQKQGNPRSAGMAVICNSVHVTTVSRGFWPDSFWSPQRPQVDACHLYRLQKGLWQLQVSLMKKSIHTKHANNVGHLYRANANSSCFHYTESKSGLGLWFYINSLIFLHDYYLLAFMNISSLYLMNSRHTHS